MGGLLRVTLFILIFPILTSAEEVTLGWDRNPENENVEGYKLHTGAYPDTFYTYIDVGNQTYCTVIDLIVGTEYWFAATAYSLYDESDYSYPINYTPEKQKNKGKGWGKGHGKGKPPKGE